MMHMSYWFGNNVGDLLFRGFTVTTTQGLIMTCLGFASLAILFEGLKVYQAYLRHKITMNTERCYSYRCSGEEEFLLCPDKDVKTRRHTWLNVLNETGFYIIQLVLSYLLMLCVMTFNGYFTISVSIGAGVGYYFFSPELFEITMKNGGSLHPKRECRTCLEAVREKEGTLPADSGALPVFGEGMVHCVAPQLPLSPELLPPIEQEQPNCCHKSVAEVHTVSV